MECLKTDEEEYRGKIIKMSRHKKKVQNEQSVKINSGTTETDNKKRKGLLKQYSIQITTVGAIIAIIESVSFLYKMDNKIDMLQNDVKNITNNIGTNTSNFNEKIDNINKDIDDINKDIDDINTQLSEMYKYLYEDDGVKDQLGEINKILNLKAINITDDEMISILDRVSVEENDSNITASPFSKDTCIGTDSEGNTYIAADLINETILLTYRENDKDIFFLGQYDENYYWNGYCVTNAYYLDGTLYGICESNFANGKRLDYKSFCISEFDTWILSNKVCQDDGNSGTNISYRFNYEKKKNFTNTNVRITDILYVDTFIENIDATVKSFYYGKTSNQLFNDDTGKAYLVTYNSDGTVKTLYMGNFKNGYFNDSTGNAWDIAYAEKYGGYVYNTGTFSNGKADNGSSEIIDIERIYEIISNHDFKCELKWKQE